MLSYSNSFYQFVTANKFEDKVCKIICSNWSGVSHWHFTNAWDNCERLLNRLHRGMLDKVLTNEQIDYLDCRDVDSISYLPAGRKLVIDNDGNWAKNGRQFTRPGKVVRKMIAPKYQRLIKDADINAFNERYRAYMLANQITFTEHPAAMIPEIYTKWDKESGGTLGNSCMRHSACYDYLKFYTLFPSLKIVTLHKGNNENTICGRFLLWETDAGTFADRFYTSRGEYSLNCIEYCKEKKYMYKQDYSSYHNKRDIIVAGNVETMTLNVRIPFNVEECEKYPYIDTLCYSDGRFLTNDSERGEITFNNTDGTADGLETYVTCYDGGRYEIGECRQIDIGNNVGEWAHCDDIVYISRRGGYALESCCTLTHDGSYQLDTDCVELHDGEWALERDAVRLHDGEWALESDAVELHDGEWALERDAVRLHDGEWALESDAVELYNGEWALESDAVELYNGEWALESDAMEDIKGNFFIPKN